MTVCGKLLLDLEQFFWYSEFFEVQVQVPLLNPNVELWVPQINSSSVKLRGESLSRLNAWLLDPLRDFNVQVLKERCSKIWSAAEPGILSRSLEEIFRASEISLSAQTRHLLNIGFVMQQFFDMSDLVEFIVHNLHRAIEFPGMPIRKFVKIIEKGISDSHPLAESALFPDKNVDKEFLFNHPKLSSFRSFVLLAKHHHALVSAHPAPPSAIRQACAIIDQWYENFFSRYRMHATELNYMRLEPTMHEAFIAFGRHGNRAQSRRRLFEPEETFDSAFELKSLLRSALLVSYPEKTATVEVAEGANISDANSDCSDISVSQNLLDQLKEFSDVHYPPELLRDISAWYDKLESGHSDLKSPSITSTGTVEWISWMPDLAGLLLRINLSACKHSADYPHFLPIDQDRLLLHAALEQKNFRSSALMEISAEAELRKNADVIAGAVTGIFLRALEFPGFGSHLVAHNGLLVFLKYANGFEEADLADNVEAVIGNKTEDMFFSSLNGNSSFAAAFPSAKITALYRTLQLLWKLVKHHPQRVRKFILPFRSVMIMKRLMRCSSYRVQRVVLKLFKVQVRFLPKKMKNLSIRFVSQVFINSNLSTEPYEDWMLTTGLSVEDENPSIAIHQGPDSVAGEAEKQEECYEVKDDNDDYGGSSWRDYTIKDINHVDWKNPDEVNYFCDRYGIPKSRVFFGFSSFEEWIHQDVLLQTSSADLFTGQ